MRCLLSNPLHSPSEKLHDMYSIFICLFTNYCLVFLCQHHHQWPACLMQRCGRLNLRSYGRNEWNYPGRGASPSQVLCCRMWEAIFKVSDKLFCFTVCLTVKFDFTTWPSGWCCPLAEVSVLVCGYTHEHQLPWWRGRQAQVQRAPSRAPPDT